MAELTYAELTQGRESTRLPHTQKINIMEKKSFLVRKVPLPGSEMSRYPGWGTRQFTDTVFEDSSPTGLETVYRHGFWRQFTDTFV